MMQHFKMVNNIKLKNMLIDKKQRLKEKDLKKKQLENTNKNK